MPQYSNEKIILGSVPDESFCLSLALMLRVISKKILAKWNHSDSVETIRRNLSSVITIKYCGLLFTHMSCSVVIMIMLLVRRFDQGSLTFFVIDFKSFQVELRSYPLIWGQESVLLCSGNHVCYLRKWIPTSLVLSKYPTRCTITQGLRFLFQVKK